MLSNCRVGVGSVESGGETTKDEKEGRCVCVCGKWRDDQSLPLDGLPQKPMTTHFDIVVTVVRRDELECLDMLQACGKHGEKKIHDGTVKERREAGPDTANPICPEGDRERRRWRHSKTW